MALHDVLTGNESGINKLYDTVTGVCLTYPTAGKETMCKNVRARVRGLWLGLELGLGLVARLGLGLGSGLELRRLRLGLGLG